MQNDLVIALTNRVKDEIVFNREQVNLKHTLLVVFSKEKMIFLKAICLLKDTALLCMKAGYERGTIETINMMVRMCMNTQELCLIRPVYWLLIGALMLFKQFTYTVDALEKLKDICEETFDVQSLI
jgi:hypothetical protein